MRIGIENEGMKIQTSTVKWVQQFAIALYLSFIKVICIVIIPLQNFDSKRYYYDFLVGGCCVSLYLSLCTQNSVYFIILQMISVEKGTEVQKTTTHSRAHRHAYKFTCECVYGAANTIVIEANNWKCFVTFMRKHGDLSCFSVSLFSLSLLCFRSLFIMNIISNL